MTLARTMIAVALVAAAGAAQAEDGADFCGQTGPMIVTYDPPPKVLADSSYAYAKTDSGMAAVIDAAGLRHATPVDERDLSTYVMTGEPVAVSSPAVAVRLLSDLDCADVHVVSLN